MNAEYIDSDGGEAVVTYTRIPGRRRSPASAAARPHAERASQTSPDDGLDRVNPREAGGFGFDVDGAGPRVSPNIDEFVEDSGRTGWARYGLIGASLAVIGGVGILAATVGMATLLPSDGARDGASGAPALASGGNDPVSGLSMTSGGIREIPLATDVGESAELIEVAPPIPRPRPDKPVIASAEAEPAPPPVLAAPQPTVGTAKQPAAAAPAVLPPPTQSASGNTDALISNIEATLARIDEGDSVETGTAAPVPVGPAAPQASAPAQAATPVAPPVVMNEPVYPPPADVSRSLAGPSYEALPPPPATVEGYETYSAGPVPPEPVPQVYPQAWPADPDTQVYPQNPGAYPADPYLLPSDTAEDPEARRPGFLRRTITKATGAVGRVFARN